MEIKYIMMRLEPKSDLKLSLLEKMAQENIQSGSIVSAVGSLSHMRVRIADGKTTEEHHENMELISLSGTLTDGHIHAHLSAINGDMEVFGGHLLEGCLVNTTMELVLLDLSAVFENKRVLDPKTGYDELKVCPK